MGFRSGRWDHPGWSGTSEQEPVPRVIKAPPDLQDTTPQGTGGGQCHSISLVHPTSNTSTADQWGPVSASTMLGLSVESLAHAAGWLCSCTVAPGWHKARCLQQEPAQHAVGKSHIRASLLKKGTHSRGCPPKLPLGTSAPQTLPRRKQASPNTGSQSCLWRKFYPPCGRMGRVDGKAAMPPAHCLPGTARAARAAPQAQPTPAGRLWGSAQSPLLMLSHPSHSCASDAKVPVPREGNPSCSRNRPTYVVPGDASEAPKPKKKGLFLSLSQSTRHLSPPASLPANGRELLSFFSRLSQPKGTSEASGRSWGSRMGGCEHPPGHKEAAGEEDAPALPCEAGHRNGQRGKGSLLTARGSCALPKSPACS